MFDWLFGNETKKQLDQTKQQLGQYQDSGAYNREMAGAMDSILKDPANKDLIATVAAQDPNFLTDWTGQMQSMRKQANFGDITQKDLQTQYDALEKKNRYNYFGDGLLGMFLNPIGQTATAGFDLLTGQYANNKRDVASDLGAGVETALSFIPLAGGIAKGAKLGGSMAKMGNAMNSTKGTIASGGLFGGAEAVRQGGAETDPMDVLTGVGTGAAFSAAIPLGGRMLRNRGSKQLTGAMAGRGMDQAAINQTMSAIPNKELYQTALRSFIPKSTFGKVALGGGALYGGSKLFGGGAPQPMSYNDYSGMEQDPYAQYQGMGY